jgi:hypothetical protein
MSATTSRLHAMLDKVDSQTIALRQTLPPAGRRVCMELLCEGREAALHGDERLVHHKIEQITNILFPQPEARE